MHDNEPPKHSNSEVCDNSTAEEGDLCMVRQKPTSGWELTNGIRQNTESDRTKKTQSEVASEVFSLCGVIIVHSYEVL
jgi:hypothetical protein